ncbi:diadenosine tetraphosphate hydrolase [Brevundimonas sp. Leaf363]|uniref:HIT domain-containing protein n=1 Tax=Brevundimonas sp. Leaf363 TaxID=1736353 RepID=UPI0006F7F179|nr:HIT domain-containing protein [Brevundimonas sp. Leaf363]KQS57397.1 diadenosine tetraphosphate hydrolase [Brevundimonas sp. Leaf363]
MSTPFTADPAFDAGSVFAADWPLCQVRLQDDARFPWLILIPRRAGMVELGDLAGADRAALWDEALRAGEVVRALSQRLGRPVDKLNTAAIGNVTAQLHLHVVGRRRDDALWPDPVWGRGPAERYDEAVRAEALRLIAES